VKITIQLIKRGLLMPRYITDKVFVFLESQEQRSFNL